MDGAEAGKRKVRRTFQACEWRNFGVEYRPNALVANGVAELMLRNPIATSGIKALE